MTGLTSFVETSGISVSTGMTSGVVFAVEPFVCSAAKLRRSSTSSDLPRALFVVPRPSPCFLVLALARFKFNWKNRFLSMFHASKALKNSLSIPSSLSSTS